MYVVLRKSNLGGSYNKDEIILSKSFIIWSVNFISTHMTRSDEVTAISICFSKISFTELQLEFWVVFFEELGL